MRKMRSVFASFLCLTVLLTGIPNLSAGSIFCMLPATGANNTLFSSAVAESSGSDVPAAEAAPEAETQSPTKEPTAPPTEAPTAPPTEAPTAEPTDTRTAEPTETQAAETPETSSPEPSVVLSESPSVEPSESPSETPMPSESPSPSPTPALVTAITLSAETTTIAVGDTLLLSVVIEPAEATTQPVMFVSGDAAIATVDETGLVTAVAEGQAVITATAQDGSGVSGVITITVLPAIPFAGEGTAEAPYEIASSDDMHVLSEAVAGGDIRYVSASYKLTADISLDGQWLPIGTSQYPFTGFFNGQGHKICRMSTPVIEGVEGYGLFGVVSGATLTRVAVEGASLNIEAGNGQSVAVGLIVGQMDGGSLSLSYSTGTIKTSGDAVYTGGLVGRLNGGVVQNCFSLAAVSATAQDLCGVLVGLAENSATVAECYHRSDPLAANELLTVGQKDTSGASIQKVYNLSLKAANYNNKTTDADAKSLNFYEAEKDASYTGFDFGTVWTNSESEAYPFPVLKDNVYTGVVTQAASTGVACATGSLPIPDSELEPLRKAAKEMPGPMGTLPSSYDLRNVIDMPDVRNQNPYGTCWSHANVAALETNLIKQGLATSAINLSEMHTVWFADRGAMIDGSNWNDPLSNFNNDHPYMNVNLLSGGYVDSGIYCYANGMTPSAENSVTSYTSTNVDRIATNGLNYSYAFNNDRYHIKGARYSVSSQRNIIKQMIMDYGAVTVSYNHEEKYMASGPCAYYAPPGTIFGAGTGHAVTIIGWDDNYARTNFASTARPSADGAWIIRNSWGTGYYMGGYFYASYYGAGFNNSLCIAYIGERSNQYAYCYQYDGSSSPFKGYPFNGPVAYQANIFTIGGTDNQVVTDVGFYVSGMSNANYKISVYKLYDYPTRPTDGKPILISDVYGQTGITGYYKVPVDSSFNLKSGDKISVVLRLQSSVSGQNAAVDVDMSNSSRSLIQYSYAKSGQSYLSDDGYTWVDLNEGQSTVASGENNRLKVFTNINVPATGVTISSAGNVTRLAKGATLQMSAAVQPINANQKVLWSITAGVGNATISADGLLTALNVGTVTVQATTIATDTSGATLLKTMQIETYLAATGVTITPATIRLIKGNQQLFTARVIPDGVNQTVSWRIDSGASFAGIDASTGLLTATAVGSVTVTAVSSAPDANGNPVSGTAQVEVYMPVTEFGTLKCSKEPTIGEMVWLSASLLPADANQNVTWTVQNGTGAATISSDGMLRGTRVGTVNVTATSVEVTAAGTHLTKNLTVTIHPYVTSVTIQPSDARFADADGNIHVSQGQSFYLQGSTLPLDAAQGISGWQLNGGGLGMHIGSDFRILDLTASTSIKTPATSTATATSVGLMSNGTRANKTISVTIHTPVSSISIGSSGNTDSLTFGKTVQMNVTILPEDAYQGFVWSVTNGTGSATITKDGLLSPVSLGTVTVTATACTLSADQQDVTSSKVITIRPYATSLSISAANDSTSVTKGATLQMSAAVFPASCEQVVVWSVLNGTGSATIDASTGLLAGVTGGTITVKAVSLATNSSGQTLSATKSMVVDAPVTDIAMATANNAAEVPLLSTLQCSATITPSDANQAVLWSVQNGTGAATVTSGGLLTGTARGTVTVTVTTVGKNSSDAAMSVSRQITVARPLNPVTAISVTSTQDYAGIGLPSLQIHATLTPTNATVQDVVWSVENGTGQASISADGVLTALATGTVTVRATSKDGENISGTKVITIRDIYITVTAEAGETRVRAGASVNLTAAITPSDVGAGAAYQWTLATGGAAYATINQSGVLTAKTPLSAAQQVTVNVSATDGRARAGTYTVTVFPAVSSIALNNNDANVAGGKVDINVTKMPAAGYMDIQIVAATLPADADDDVTWSLTDCSEATLTTDGNTATVRVTAGCSPTLTATAKDGSGVLSRTLINAYSGPVKVLVSGNDAMSAGGEQTLNTTVYPLNTPDASYTYSIVSGSGTILQNGTLTAAVDAAGQTIVVRATSVDPTVYADFTVSVQEAASSIQVEAYLDGQYQVINWDNDDLYIPSLSDEGIRIRVTPLPLTASQDVTIHNYYPDIFTVERIGTTNEYWIKPHGYGDEMFWIDSAAKTTSLTVHVSELVKSIQISGPTGISAGKSIQLTADAQPTTAFNRVVKWSIDGYNATAATVTATGILRCRAAFSGALTVRATAADGGGTVATYNVYQMDAPSSVTVLDGDGNITTTLMLDCSKPDPVTLHAAVQPDTAYQDILWNTGSAKVITCTVDPDTGDLSVTPVANGSTTITASTKEGSARKATVKVNVITLAQSAQPVGMAYDAESGRWSCNLMAGKALKLMADILPSTTSNKKITWSLDSAYPGVSLSGTTLKTTASAAGQTVIVRGTAADGNGAGCECAASIVASGTDPITILQDSVNVTGATVEFDMAGDNPSLTLTAQPEDTTVFWSVSPASAAKLANNADGSVTVTPLKTGNLILTATAVDGSRVKASVKVSVVSKVKSISIAYPAGIAAGKRVKPTVTLNPVKPSYQKIEWALTGASDSQYATISATTGEIRALSGGHSIQVQAFAWTDAQGLIKIPSNTVTVELSDSAVSSVVIYNQDRRDVSKKSISFRPADGDLRFSASTLPDTASGEIRWTLSSNKVMTLTVDTDTNEAVIHATGNGSAILKAVSQDGSGKYAQVTLKANSVLVKVVLTPEYPVYMDGYYLRVNMTYAPYSASILRSTWEMAPKGDMSGFRIDIGDWHVNKATIWDAGSCLPGDSFLVTCTASTGAYATVKIPVVSKPTSLDILQDGISVNKAQLPLAEGAELSLTAAALPDTAYQQFKWESLTPGIATVTLDDTTGTATVVRVGEGIATIRVSALDGSGKTAYVLITEP